MAAFDYKSVLKPKTVLALFNPNRVEVAKDFNGNTYRFPAGGVLEIEDTQAQKHTKEGTFEQYMIPASEIVEHFIGSDGVSGHLGPLGVRVLSGDPEIDEQIKEEARQVCKVRMYVNDLATKNAHMAAVKVAKESGQPAPSPERHVIEAFKRIEEYEAGGNDALPFSCPDCALPALTQIAVDQHREAQHRGATVAPQATGSSAEVEALKAQVATLTELMKAQLAANTAAPRKPGRPKKEISA